MFYKIGQLCPLPIIFFVTKAVGDGSVYSNFVETRLHQDIGEELASVVILSKVF